MILAVDTYYDTTSARTAGVLFENWIDPEPVSVHVHESGRPVAEYVPGRFYERELPCILSLLERLPRTPSIIVIDGYVSLDASGRKGLGRHLFDDLGEAKVVVGVAKSGFARNDSAVAITRGGSGRALFVTAAGMAVAEAAKAVKKMHGDHRIPTLLRLADQLSRSGTSHG